MAVMDNPNRLKVGADWMNENRDVVSISKTEVQAAIDALDDFLNSNAAAINSAIPEPARSSLSTAQKARMLKGVITRRFIVGA